MYEYTKEMVGKKIDAFWQGPLESDNLTARYHEANQAADLGF